MGLRLLMTADTTGGVWVYALSLCRTLALAGVSVRLVALGEPSEEQYDAANRLDNVELVVQPGQLEWMDDPWRDLDALEAALPALAEDTDLVHFNHLTHGHLDLGRPVVCAVHACVLSWFEAVRGRPAPTQWQHYRSRVTRSLKGADHIVAPSRWMLQRASELYGPLHRRSVIANGSDAPFGDPDSSRSGVLAAGRVWDDGKNLGPVAAIAPRLSAPLRVAGPRRVPDTHATDGFGVPGHVPQRALWAQMRSASVYLAPALYEPFGLGVLEAARSGCALVLGDIETLRETWQGAAMFVDPHRPEDWEWAVEHLLANPAEQRRLARAAQARASGYTLKSMGQCYLALYQRTLDVASMPRLMQA